jgi:hypothetical protein
METQEMFDKICKHAKLGVKSIGMQGCKYRGDNGSKCFVGVFIDDSDYIQDLERCSVWQLTEMKKIPADKSQVRFLKEMQGIHDGFSVEEWHGKLEKYSTKNGLQFNW